MPLNQPVRRMPFTSFNWKFNPEKDVQIIREKQPIMAPPMTNTSRVANSTEVINFLDAAHNDFSANPIKHWRKQYSTTSPTVMGRPVPVKNNMAIINEPGYTTISQNTNNNPDCLNKNNCQSDPVEPDYMVAYRSQDSKDNVFGKGVKVLQRDISGAPQYERCVSVCDPERAARRRTQYPSAINTQVYTNNNELCYNKSKYNQSNAEYLKSRCRTYTQNMANKKAGAPRPWDPKTTDCPSCPGECGLGNSCNSSCKKQIIYKPNNYKFTQQGAASSSSGIHRKKYNTIQRFAAQFTKPGFKGLYGDATAAAYAYSSNTNTPFTIKDKTYTAVQCRTDLHNLRRQGKFDRSRGDPSTITCPGS